jgi:hypothetical protein
MGKCVAGRFSALRKCFALEMRGDERVQTVLDGTLFVRGTSTTLECFVVDISASGVRVRCRTPLRAGTPVIVFIEGLGRFEAITSHRAEDTLGIRFTCSEAKRQRLVEKLNGLVGDAPLATGRKRMHQRVPSLSSLWLLCQNGQELECDVLDISLQGLSLKTKGRPPLGEIVKVGHTYGRVVRHHENGIAIFFATVSEADKGFAGISPK